MITLYYKISVGRLETTNRVAYIKTIDGGEGDVIRFFIEGVESGRICIGGEELLVQGHVATVKANRLSEGIVRPTLYDGDGYVYHTEAFLYEGGFVKHAPVPAGFPSKVTEAFEVIEREFEHLEQMFLRLATAFSGESLFKFD